MGPLGWQETVFIFLLALLIFGPKKLPELGKTIGKAMTEFRRASSELKSTFDREMVNLERETEPLKEISRDVGYDSYNYDSYDYGSYDQTSPASSSGDSTATATSTPSASATEGAESTTAEATGPVAAEAAAPANTVHRTPASPSPASSGDTSAVAG
ncbi:MAG: twin-arginine translocase TatA/TatE family subunit [Bryobacterales bacterium]|jgi:TatA/E family protein of Tat protein translocase|nr:twin-arginine translocase TatA/TatE family subunit [Bryobacterales bacterium]